MIKFEPIKYLSGLEQHTKKSGRYYTDADGNKYYSVTTVLSILNKEAIMAWRKRVGEEEANKISSQAATRGTKVHNMIEKYIVGEEFDTDNLVALSNFKDIQPIIDQNLSKIHAVEARLFSKHLGLAGTVDCVGIWDGQLSIIDWKTSKKYKRKEWCENYFMQASAYAIMWEERTGMPITNLVVAIAGDEGPQIFIEHRDNWDKKLIETIEEYNRRKNDRSK